MTLTRQRAFVTPHPNEDWRALAARVRPDDPTEATIETLKSWNLHLFARNPPGEFTGSDVIFIEPPREGDSFPLPGLSSGSEAS